MGSADMPTRRRRTRGEKRKLVRAELSGRTNPVEAKNELSAAYPVELIPSRCAALPPFAAMCQPLFQPNLPAISMIDSRLVIGARVSLQANDNPRRIRTRRLGLRAKPRPEIFLARVPGSVRRPLP